MLVTSARSAALPGARKHTALNTFSTWHWAKASLLASSSPSDLAPLPLPGSAAHQPSSEFWPLRQRFSQLSSGVTKPGLKLSALMKYFALHGCRRVERIEPGASASVVEVVVRERLRHRIHAAVAADAVVQEDAAVATGRAAHVLADAIRRPRGVVHLLHVAAHVIHQREAEHRAVGAVDEERLRRRRAR